MYTKRENHESVLWVFHNVIYIAFGDYLIFIQTMLRKLSLQKYNLDQICLLSLLGIVITTLDQKKLVLHTIKAALIHYYKMQNGYAL
jgi:hypothetical protein